jgi:hypothetical protein
LLVWADGEPNQNSTNQSDLHVNFQLNKGGEAIGLFAPDGAQVDAITFGNQTSDVSEGRCPDGSTNIVMLAVSTPRAANTCPNGNTAPVLAPIGNKFVHQGQTLSFTAQATDSEAPPQALTFSLDAGAPAGASITSGGFFTWSTAGAPAPSTNLITVRVGDNGSPSLDDSETLTLVVLAPLSFNVVSLTASQLRLSWEMAPGQTYQVEYKDNLNAANWTPLDSTPTAAGNSLSVTVNVSGPPQQRFYRVRPVQ